MELKQVKGSLNAEALAVGSLMSTPLALPTHLLMKILKIGVLEKEGMQEMTMLTSRLRN